MTEVAKLEGGFKKLEEAPLSGNLNQPNGSALETIEYPLLRPERTI